MTPLESAALPRPVAMVTHSYYEEDPRVRREAEAVAATGREVDVFALRRPDDPATDVIEGVHVRRLGVQRHQGAGLATYVREYLAFLVRSGWALTRAHGRRRYGLVQVHTLPDFLVFAATPLRITGVPVILDMHEAMPEFFRSRFATDGADGSRPGPGRRLAIGVLRLQERLSIGFSTRVVTVNDALGDRLVQVGVPRSKVQVVPNAPSLARFDPTAYPMRPFMADGTLRLVYAGALSPIYELDVVVEALAILRRERPALPVCLDLYGRDFAEVPLRDRLRQLDLADTVTFHGRVPIEAVPAAIAMADVGLAPTRRSAFTDYSLSTKAFEYAAMAKPVVASRLPMVERIFAGDVATYSPGDAADLVAVLTRLVDDAGTREALVARASERVRALGWETARGPYLALVDELALGAAAGSAAR